MIFTDKNVLSLPARRKGYLIWDGGNGRNSGEVQRGLGIRVSSLGAKSYRSMFYFPGSSKSHMRWIGDVGVMTLAEARDQCRQDRRNSAKGIDPRAGDPSNAGSYLATVNAYVEKVQIGEKHNVRAEACRQVLLTNTKTWHTRNVATITNSEIRNLLETIRDGDDKAGVKPRPYLANLVHARMKPMFDWCTQPGINRLEVSPMHGLRKPFSGAQRRERPWFSSDTADTTIKTLWAAADKLDHVDGRFLRMLLLTGKRKTALANMRWEQIDENWFWNAPPGNKNKRAHKVPLRSGAADFASTSAKRICLPRQTLWAHQWTIHFKIGFAKRRR